MTFKENQKPSGHLAGHRKTSTEVKGRFCPNHPFKRNTCLIIHFCAENKEQKLNSGKRR